MSRLVNGESPNITSGFPCLIPISVFRVWLIDGQKGECVSYA